MPLYLYGFHIRLFEFLVTVKTTRLPTVFIETRNLIVSRPGLTKVTHRRTTQVIKDSPEGRTFIYVHILYRKCWGIEFTITSRFVSSKLCYKYG